VKQVLTFIEEQKQEFIKLPLFKFMQDQNIDPRQRLSFAPCMAYLILSFADLNKYVFRRKPVVNKIQEFINDHTYENDYQWPWFVTGMEKMGFNHTLSFTQALRFLWTEETKITRQLAYQISGYTLQANPLQKKVIIQSLTATSDVLLSKTRQVALGLQETLQTEYLYLGQFHLMLELGHLMVTPESEKLLGEIQLTEETRQDAFELVENVFELFSEWTHELLAYAQMHNAEPALHLLAHV
jgi:hypothetical protein